MRFKFTDCYTNWGFSPKVPRMRFVNAVSKEEKGKFRKKLEG
jgi:hypothetical protein